MGGSQRPGEKSPGLGPGDHPLPGPKVSIRKKVYSSYHFGRGGSAWHVWKRGSSSARESSTASRYLVSFTPAILPWALNSSGTESLDDQG